MSNQASSLSHRKKHNSSHPKPQSPLTINLSPFADLQQHASSKNFAQKENFDCPLQKSNSFMPAEFIRPISQQSCRNLKPCASQLQSFNSFKVQPNSARNQNPPKINNFVMKSADFSKKSPDLIYKEHLFQTFQAVKFMRNLPQPDSDEINNKKIWLSKRKGYENKRTIVFDLDETLVHCVENPVMGDFSISISISQGQVLRAGVNIRPFAREVLASANKDFEVIVFTASSRCYADEVLDYLDPTGELIHHRLYRENCLHKAGVYIKDLRVFANRNLQDIVIVDNSAYCFAYQLENGIPIISWFDDNNDRELYKLIDYLKILANVPDITLVNRHPFHLNTFYNDYLRDFLRHQD